MKKTPPAEPPEPTPKRTPSGKVSKDKKIELAGQRVTELAKDYAELPTRERNKFAEALVRERLTISPEALATIVAESIPEKIAGILAQVRDYVREDQTYPVPAKYLGRALKDMNAVGKKNARNRIDIMAFFHTGPARGIIRAPRGREVDYRVTAETCSVHRAGALATNPESNNASKGLETAVVRLEVLKLADSEKIKIVSKATGKEKEKRTVSYLLDFGGVVFDRWPLWPGEA